MLPAPRYWPPPISCKKTNFLLKTTDLCHNLIHAHLHRLHLDPVLEADKSQIIGDTIKFHQGLLQIALAYNFFEPIRAAMEMSQYLMQAVPLGSSPLQQLPGIDAKLARELEMRDKQAIKGIQDLLGLKEEERRRALEALDEGTYGLAMDIARQIPILIVSNAHFKGISLKRCRVGTDCSDGG